MKIYLEMIDLYLQDAKSEFWKFYNSFQDSYFGDDSRQRNAALLKDEIELMDDINDVLAIGGVDPDENERRDGIIDQHEVYRRIATLKEQNIGIWKRHASG